MDEAANLILERLNRVLDRISAVDNRMAMIEGDLLNLSNAQREQGYGLGAKVDSLRGYIQNRDDATRRNADHMDAIDRRLDAYTTRLDELSNKP
jgi:hypothetical protein